MAGQKSEKSKRKPIRELGESCSALIRTVDEVCRNCGDSTMKASASYLRRALYFGDANKFWFGTFLNCCFYYGYAAKDHFRLIAIAVDTDHQGFGFGSMMLTRIIQRCEDNGLKEITLRTHKAGKAFEWWKKQGAVIVGENGTDWEMKISL